jgi:phosphoketolase
MGPTRVYPGCAWQSNKFLNPVTDGAVLPILHLNGYKIANPTILGRISHGELEDLFIGYGYKPYFVEGADPDAMHGQMAATLDLIVDEIREIKKSARSNGVRRPRWPILILRSPKGWTGPREIDGVKVEGYWKSHQVPFSDVPANPEHLARLEEWLKSYKPEELFDEKGALRPELAELAPRGTKRMGANPHANGGLLLRDLILPDFRSYVVDVPKPGQVANEATRILGTYLRNVIKLNKDNRNFRLFGPDETTSNRLGAVFEVTDRTWIADTLPEDDHLSPDGRVMEILSEHTCQGWLEGEPDVVMACCGDVPTIETLAAVALLRQYVPDLKVRVINVVDLMTLQPPEEHPHGLSHRDFDSLFTTNKPIIFAFHGYPWLIHRLTYRRTNHHNLHVRGYKEEGTTTTPFDNAVRNDIDRFHLVVDVVNRVPRLAPVSAYIKQTIRDKLIEHEHYITEHGQDMPEIRGWKWPY